MWLLFISKAKLSHAVQRGVTGFVATESFITAGGISTTAWIILQLFLVHQYFNLSGSFHLFPVWPGLHSSHLH